MWWRCQSRHHPGQETQPKEKNTAKDKQSTHSPASLTSTRSSPHSKRPAQRQRNKSADSVTQRRTASPPTAAATRCNKHAGNNLAPSGVGQDFQRDLFQAGPLLAAPHAHSLLRVDGAAPQHLPGAGIGAEQCACRQQRGRGLQSRGVAALFFCHSHTRRLRLPAWSVAGWYSACTAKARDRCRSRHGVSAG